MILSEHAQRRSAGNRPPPGVPRRGRPRPTTPAPPRDARVTKCANCNQPGHTTLQCTRPKVSLEQRRCHVSNKVGHAARRCPDASKPAPSKSANIVNERDKAVIVIRSDEGDFQPARPGRSAIPRQRISLGDMPVIGRTGSQRERRKERFDAQSDNDSDENDEHSRRPDGLTNLGKWDLFSSACQ